MDHTATEAVTAEAEPTFDDLARLMIEALTASHTSGYASGAYVYDRRATEADLTERRDRASDEAVTTQQEMWRVFYALTSR